VKWQEKGRMVDNVVVEVEYPEILRLKKA